MKLLVIPVFAAITLFPYVVVLRDSHPVQPNIPALVILGLMSVAFWYWILAESFNRITVTVSCSAPSPVGWVRFPASGTLRDGNSQRSRAGANLLLQGDPPAFGIGNFYDLMARTKDRKRVIITAGHDDPEIVLTLGRLIRDRLETVEVSLDIPNDVDRRYAGPYLDNRQRRALRILFYGIGGCIILLSMFLAGIRTAHITTLRGVRGDYSVSGTHPVVFGRYSFPG